MNAALIYTGGTIGGIPAKSGPVVRAFSLPDFEALLEKRLPSGVPAVPVQGALGKLSENLEPADWGRLARVIDRQIRRGANGVVVAHGTDTMVYTACALRWLLEGVPVPVVLTGSRLPLAEPGTDAIRNLVHAFSVVRQAGRPGVRISFAGSSTSPSLVLDPGNARKVAGRPDLFQPVRGIPDGIVSGPRGRIAWRHSPAPVPGGYAPRFKVEGKAVLFTLHPGFQPEWIRRAARQGIRGIVLAGFGSGTACAEGAFDLRPAVRDAVKLGVRVWMVSQHGGRVETAYGSTAALERAGVKLMDFTPEAALTALMCLPEDRCEALTRTA